jgi:hypothetical protein
MDFHGTARLSFIFILFFQRQMDKRVTHRGPALLIPWRDRFGFGLLPDYYFYPAGNRHS